MIYSLTIVFITLLIINLPKFLEDRHKVIKNQDIYLDEIRHILKGVTQYEENKDFKKCINLHKMALDIYKKKLPNEHSAIVKTMNNLAGAYLDDNQKELAIVIYKKAYEFAVAHEVTDEHFAVLLNNIGHCYKKLNRNKESLKWLEKSLPYYEHIYGLGDKKTKILKHNIKFLKEHTLK